MKIWPALVERARLHVFVLSRPFALPAVVCGVILGSLQTHPSTLLMVLAIGCAATVTAWGHSMNTFLDYMLGMDTVDTKPKSYNMGNQVIVRGMMRTGEVLANAVVWLLMSATLAAIIAVNTTLWVFLPWTLMVMMTFVYSFGKRHYLCETALGLAGSFTVMLGAACSKNFTFHDFGPAFMSSLALAWVFGFGAEFLDQAFDADVDSGKNMGALARRIGVHPVTFMCVLLAFAYIIQIALVIGGFLAPLTLSTLALMPPFVYCIMMVCETPAFRNHGYMGGTTPFNNKATMAAMVVMFLWMLSVVISQAVAT